MPESESARSFGSPEEVNAILSSGKYTFDETLDCAQIAKAEGDWQLVDRSVSAALESIGRRRIPEFKVKDVLYLLVKARLKGSRTLDELEADLDHIERRLTDLGKALPNHLGPTVEEVRRGVADVIVLLLDDNPASYSSLCARLRKLERSDLGVVAAGRALSAEPQNAKALNTRAAAHMDQNQLVEAGADAELAYQIEQSHFVANTLSRYWGRRGDWDEAIRWARRANELDPEGIAGMYALAKAASVINDRAMFDQALAAIKDREEQQTLFATRDKYIETRIAQHLFDDGELDASEAVVDGVLSEGEYGPARALKLEIEAKRRRRSRG